jgi:glycerol-3-phosphate acyltransferase PlsY
MDALKGWVAVEGVTHLVFFLFGKPLSEPSVFRIVAAFAAVLGHNYPCWLNFKGGKGIATSAGVLAALVPSALMMSLSVWIVLLALTRYVSIGSIAGSFTLPFTTWFTTKNWTLTIATGAMGALAIYKHKANIQRLLSGTESRIGSRPKEAVK